MQPEEALTDADMKVGRRPTMTPAPPARPLERQLVWRRTIELLDSVEQHDRVAVALELLRTAHHDAATMAHALVLGRSRVRDHPADRVARRAAGLLERAITFLGVRPRIGEVGAGAVSR